MSYTPVIKEGKIVLVEWIAPPPNMLSWQIWSVSMNNWEFFLQSQPAIPTLEEHRTFWAEWIGKELPEDVFEIKYLFKFFDGHYTNKCSICKNIFHNGDKLQFICEDCAHTEYAIPKQVKEPDIWEGERILCAAIWYMNESKATHDVKNIDKGIVVCGRRHHNCISIYHTLTGKNTLDRATDIQGFLTSKDRFVDRTEAYHIAKKAGQLLHTMHDDSNPTLISEDLY